ncbi:MAG TPA: class I SAM-dependent methyltransferase [Polyangia bacterium]|nr:class I SAM-dependent methyltransferase [Polyangia bacterium]
MSSVRVASSSLGRISSSYLVWAALPDVIAGRLRTAASVLEIGCGQGLGCLAMAAAFPDLAIIGHDPDAAAVERARALARSAGLDERVRFAVSDSLRLERSSIDVVVVSGGRAKQDALPLLNAVRNALTPDGACLLVEPAPARALRGATARRDTDAALRAAAQRVGFSRLRRLHSTDRSVLIFELQR